MALPDMDNTKRVYPKHPDGSHQLALADVIFLGKRVTEDGKTKERYLQPRVALVLQSMECEPGTANRFTLSREFTYTDSDRGNLRQFLNPWLGPFKDDAHAKQVITTLDERVGENGLFSVVHESAKDGSGKVYVNVQTAGKLVKGMQPFRVAAYLRPEYFAKKMATYAADRTAFEAERQVTAAKEGQNFEDFPAALAQPAAGGGPVADDLPF